MSPSSIFNSRVLRAGCYRAWWIALALLSPWLLAIGAVEGTLWRAGETVPARLAFARLARAPADACFMRQVFDQALYRFKYLGWRARRPAVVALGTSRVMQFRREMFGPDAPEFFNAGGMVQHVRDLEELAADPRLPAPRTLLLGIELWWFNAPWAAGAERRKHYAQQVLEDDALDGFAHAAVFQRLFRRTLTDPAGEDAFPALARRAWSAGAAERSRRIGWLALRKGVGFRADGSFRYAETAPSPEFVDREQPPIPVRIRERQEGYEPVAGPSPGAVDRLLRSLERLQQRGVRVICFFPPFSRAAAAALEESDATRALWSAYRGEFAARIRGTGAALVDASTTDRLGLDDRYLYDGLHPMETFQLALLRAMLDQPGARAALRADPAALDRILRDPQTNPWFPAYPPPGKEN